MTDKKWQDGPIGTRYVFTFRDDVRVELNVEMKPYGKPCGIQIMVLILKFGNFSES